MIHIAPALLDAIRRHAAETWPLECCGLLVGPKGADGDSDARPADDPGGGVRVNERIPCRNVAAEPARAFEIDPQARFDTERRLRGTADAIVGHYHSHPGGPARPSATDLALAFEPRMVWLIVAVENGEAGDARAFRVEDGAFREFAIAAGA